MKYCIDTSAFINLGERHYPEHIPVFKPIWDHLYEGINNGNIVSVDYVKIELEKKADDWRTAFIQSADDMFHISDEIEKEYAQAIAQIESNPQFLKNKHRDRFMDGADPWVIALAKSLKECTVVSGETKKLSDYGLGEVCKVLGVRHISLIKFIEENKIGG